MVIKAAPMRDPEGPLDAEELRKIGCLLARYPLSLRRHDLFARQPAIERAFEDRARQKPPPGPLGHGPWTDLHLGASEPFDQEE